MCAIIPKDILKLYHQQMQNFLQQFLNAGMLQVGDDDSRFNTLRSAAQDVAKELGRERSKLVPYTLAALDVNLSPQEPLIQSVEAAIKKHWNTFRNKFPEPPVQLVRAVILEALDIEAGKQPTSAAIISLTATSYWPFTELGTEENLLLPWLRRLQTDVEAVAAEMWTSSSPAKVSKLSMEVTVPKLTWSKSDVKALQAHLLSASGPNGENPNAYAYNQQSQWSTHFATEASQGIATVVDASQKELANQTATAIATFSEQLNEQLTAFLKQLESVQSEVTQGSVVQERKIALLWWKESLF